MLAVISENFEGFEVNLNQPIFAQRCVFTTKFQHLLSERLMSLGIMGEHSGAPLKPLGDDSALRTLSSLRGLRGAPEVPPSCRETQSLGQQMLKEPLSINGLTHYTH